MRKVNFKKLIFSIGLVPILALPLVLTSCFNTQTTQFPPKEVLLSASTTGTIGIIPEDKEGIPTGKPPKLTFTTGGYVLGEDVFPASTSPTGDFTSFDDPEIGKKWTQFSKYYSTLLTGNIINGSGRNVDGTYTTLQIFESILFNKITLENDKGPAALGDIWNDFMILQANTFNQASGVFVDNNNEILFDVSGLNLSVSASVGKTPEVPAIGETDATPAIPGIPRTIPYEGTLPGFVKGALETKLYNTEVKVTISGATYSFFNFDGIKKDAPKIEDPIGQYLKKIGYKGNTIPSSFELSFPPVTFTIEKWVYKIDEWKNKEKFPPPFGSPTIPVPTAPETNPFKGFQIFTGITLNGKNITNAENKIISDSVNGAQKLLLASKPRESQKMFKIAMDKIFIPDTYKLEEPITSIFTIKLPLVPSP